ncbi:MAG: hypothetical protein QOD93_4212 [Acetobacteraceae bacterium]|nr:hypothetical protein [Rhodopila sp.]MEA2771250.1 hypothetical protein [Acetobacteraceae bacterium]
MMRNTRLAILGAVYLILTVNTTSATSPPPASGRAPVEYGIDRSNMGTQWTISWPSEPNRSPFLLFEYNKPGNSEARRIAVFDGIARLHPKWFRDGFGKGPESLFVDTIQQVHARGMKMLTVFGPVAADFPQTAYLTPAQSGCQWGVYPLSKINLESYRKRIEAQFQAVQAAHQAIEAFEIGNEFDLHRNDADSPTGSEWATHNWHWFLTSEQVQAFVKGYAPYLATSVAAIRKYFPHAKIITFGLSMPAAAPLIQALASVRDDKGKVIDYTEFVDAYGLHIYPTSDTTPDLVKGATANLAGEAAFFPHLKDKPIWITEWNATGSSSWNGKPWYFQYSMNGQPGGDLNKADAQGVYKPMDRAEAIRVFQSGVVDRLRSSPTAAVNVGYVFYYSYDSAWKSSQCDKVGFNKSIGLGGICFDGVIDRSTGQLLPGIPAAVMNTPHCRGVPASLDTIDLTDCPK